MNSFLQSWNSSADVWWAWAASAFWQSAVVGLVILAFVAFAKQWSSRVKYGLLLIALVKFAVPPLWSAPTGLLSQMSPATHHEKAVVESQAVEGLFEANATAQLPANADQQPEFPSVAAAINGENEAEFAKPAFDDSVGTLPISDADWVSEIEMATQPIADANTGVQSDAESIAAAIWPTWKAWLLLIYALGCAMVLSLIAKRLSWLSSVVRSSQEAGESIQLVAREIEQRIQGQSKLPSRRVRVLQSDQVDSPMAFGILQPTIVLPDDAAGYSNGDLRTVLGHELAHLRQGDGWINWLQLGLLTVWWFHPVFWLVQRSVRRVSEDCCDDMLIATGLTTQDDYCDTLLRVADRPLAATIPVACGMASHLHPLGKRIKRIMDSGINRTARLSYVHLICIVVTAVVFLPGLRSESVEAQNDQSETVAGEPPEDDEDNAAQVEGLPIAEPEFDPYSGSGQFAIELKPLTIFGKCVNAAGDGVAGAEIRLIGPLNREQYQDTDGTIQQVPTIIAKTTSADDGSYRFQIERYPVRHYKPDPVEKPREAHIRLVGIAADLALAWRSERTVRFEPRPTFVDPDEQASVFFENEPIELDLTFLPEVRVHGIVKDDTGRPLEGAQVQLGMVNTTRSLPGQTPRTYSYSAFQEGGTPEGGLGGVALRELPERFRVTATDASGHYELRGFPPNTRARIAVRHKRAYSASYRTVISADGESAYGDYYVGTDGECNFTLTSPRLLSVSLTADGNAIPECTIRAMSHDDPRKPILHHGALQRSGSGQANLELPPGKYTIFVEPKPGQPFVASKHEIEVPAMPLKQDVKFHVPLAARVALRAVEKDSGKVIPGVGFTMRCDSNDPVELQSQTVYVDHPRTNTSGILEAIAAPGKCSFEPTVVPAGYSAVSTTTKVHDLQPGRKTFVLVEFDANPDAAAASTDSPTDKRLAKLFEAWEQQRRLLSHARYVYTGNTFVKGKIPPVQFESVLATLDGKSVAQQKEMLQHVFPDLKLNSSSTMLVDGIRVATANHWSEPTIRWQGMDVSDLSINNGLEQLRYNPANNQLDILLARRSNFHVGGLEDVATIPRAFRKVIPGLKIQESDQELNLSVNGMSMSVDRETGFLHEVKTGRDHNARIVRQYGPTVHSNGAATPALRIQADIRNGQFDRIDISFLDQVEFVEEFPADAFVIPAPAGTNVIDDRDTASGSLGRTNHTSVLRAPVTDVVAHANALWPKSASARTSQAAGAGGNSFGAAEEAGLKRGDLAPPFQVAGWYDQNGKTTAPDISGKVLVIQFFPDGPANNNAGQNRVLRDALKLFAERNVEFINLYGHETDPVAAAKWMKEFHLPWKFAIDTPVEGKPKHFPGRTFEAFESPWGTTTIVIDSAGRVDSTMQHTRQANDAVKRAEQLTR